MMNKFDDCYTCMYKEDTTWSYENCICQKCTNIDPETGNELIPASEYRYEDPEGEWK